MVIVKVSFVNMPPNTCHFIGSFIVLIIINGVVCQQDLVLRSLADHNDRITDLELFVQNVSSLFTAVHNEMTQLKDENIDLRQQVKDLTDQCRTCCISDTTTASSPVTSQTGLTASSTSKLDTTDIFQTNATSNMVPTTNKRPSDTVKTTTTKLTTSEMPSTTIELTSDTATTTVKSTMPPKTTEAYTTTSPTSLSATTSTTPSPPLTTTTLKTTTQTPVFDSCEAALTTGDKMKRVKLQLGSTGSTIDGVCELKDGVKWLIIQRRVDGSVNFNRLWNEYKQGFGIVNETGEFWLGNENIYKLTNRASYRLRIDMEDWEGHSVYAEYQHFTLTDETDNYRLNVASYSGDAGDSFHYYNSYMLQHHHMPFSTRDRDHDNSSRNCAQILHGGWWFNNCYSSNLNGFYLARPKGLHQTGETWGQPSNDGTGIEWYPYRREQYSMKRVEMKISTSTAVLIG